MRLLLTLVALTVCPVLLGQATEICDNGVNDDGNALIDCQDLDCLGPEYTASSQALGGFSISLKVSLGNVDGDGDLNAWVANAFDQVNATPEPNRVWLNDGLGSFTDSGQAIGNSGSFGVALGDVNGDGDLNAWVANAPDFYFGYPGGNKVWLNDGAGSYTDSGQSLGNSRSRAVSLGNVDGDGDLDACVANDTFQADRVWLNDGNGSYIDSGQTLGSSTSLSVSLGDVDGDGDLDAWVATGDAQPNKVWLNNGLGTFSDSGQLLGNAYSFSVALGDLDGDGDLDAWVANQFAEPDRVWANDGLGNYFDTGQALGSTNSAGVALGDFNVDGDLDAWVSCEFLDAVLPAEILATSFPELSG